MAYFRRCPCCVRYHLARSIPLALLVDGVLAPPRPKAIPFLKDVVVRETLTALRQFGFRYVPPDVRKTLSCAFEGFVSTAVNENAHNVLKDHGRDSKNHRMSRVNRYMFPHSEGVLGSFDRLELQSNPAARRHSRVLKPAVFEACAGEPSVPDKTLRAVIGAAPAWPSFSPQAALLIPAAMSLLLEVHKQGAWHELEHAWQAVAMASGMVVERLTDHKFFLVLEASPFGILAWPCSQEGVGEARCIAISTGRGDDASWERVRSLDDWRCWPFEVESPLMLRSRQGFPNCSGLHLVCADSHVSVMRAAALGAFSGVTDYFLSKLLVAFGVQPKAGQEPPRTMLARLDLLVRWALPEKSDAEVADILAGRFVKPVGGHEGAHGLLDNDLARECMDAVMDPSDKKVCQDDIKTQSGPNAACARLRAFIDARGYPLPARLDEAAGTGKDRCAADEVTRQKVKLSRSSCKQYLPKPPKGGVVLQPYPQQQRFQIYYPTSLPPHSHTERWGVAGRTEVQAAKLCLLWAWGHHELQTGERCPWEFGG